MKSQDDPRIDAAVAELQQLIRDRYPETIFTVAPGEDPEGIYVTATVDVEDPDDVFDVVVGPLLQMQVEDRIPVYVIPVQPVERVLADLRTREPAYGQGRRCRSNDRSTERIASVRGIRNKGEIVPPTIATIGAGSAVYFARAMGSCSTLAGYDGMKRKP